MSAVAGNRLRRTDESLRVDGPRRDLGSQRNKDLAGKERCGISKARGVHTDQQIGPGGIKVLGRTKSGWKGEMQNI